MCLRGRPIQHRWLGLLAAMLAGAPVLAQTDPVADYLSKNNLHHLLALHLEQRIASTEDSSQRRRLAAGLADVYVRLIDSAELSGMQEDLEARGAALIRELGDEEGIELRLSLARSAYQRAEANAERLRMTPVDLAQRREVERQLREAAPRLEVIAMTSQERVRILEEQQEAAGADDELLRAALATLRRIRLQSAFLAGWARAYLTEFDAASAAEHADAALAHFGVLLNAEHARPATPERVRAFMLDQEHNCRAIIGCALASERAGRSEDADRWLDILRSAQALPKGVQDSLPSWTMVILAHRRDWLALQALITRLDRERAAAPGATTLTAPEAGLLAVLVAPEAASDATARRLVSKAAEQLVLLGELATLSELAPVLLPALDGPAPDPIASLIRGLRDIGLAQSRRGGPGEPLDETASRMLVNARAALKRAHEATDDGPGSAPVRAAALLGEAYATDLAAGSPEAFLDAASLYERASVEFEPIDAARAVEAQLNAVRACMKAGDSPAAGLQKRKAIDRLLDRFPDHPLAAGFAIQRALEDTTTRAEAIKLLRAIGRSSPHFRAAQRAQARMLFLDYREARAVDRAAAAERFLILAREVLATDAADDRAGSLEDPAPAAEVARLVLDCALAQPTSQAGIAQQAYDLLASLMARGAIGGGSTAAEFHYRTVQMALLRGDTGRADAAAAALRDADPAAWRHALGLMFDDASRRWRSIDPPLRPDMPLDADSVRVAERTVGIGRALLRELEREPVTDASIQFAVESVTAHAAGSLWYARGREPDLELSALLYRAAIRSAPDSRALLEQSWRILRDAGDLEAAMDSLRRLTAGYRQASPEWFAARTEFLILMAEVDPAQAAVLLEQHANLHPELGPEPHGARLRTLRSRLGGVRP